MTASSAIEDGTLDRRSKELHLTKAGAERLRVAWKLWSEAQMQFEAAFGGERASALRNELRAVASSELARRARRDASRNGSTTGNRLPGTASTREQ